MSLRNLRSIAFLLLAAAVPAAAQQDSLPLRVERILTPSAAAKAHLGLLCPSLAVTPNGVAVVGDGNQLWAVGADGAVSIAGIHNANSFAMSPEGLLVVVSSTSLQYLDPNSKALKLIFQLPAAGLRIVSENKDSFLLFGPDGFKGFALYELLPGRKAVKVIHTQHPITGVARLGDELLLVSGGALFAVYQNSLLLLAGEIGGQLHSVAVDDSTGRIFLSDGQSLFQMQQGKLTPLVSDLGGELRWQSGGLLIFKPQSHILTRLVNLPEGVVAP